MTSWFRSWHGAPTDNKWLVIAAKAKVKPGIVSAVAWALFDHASQADERGSVADFDTETYAVFSGFDECEVEAVITAMRAKCVIDQDNRLAAWDKRQPKREDDSSERVRNLRKRRNGDGSNGNSKTVTLCNAEERTETHVTHTEAEAEAEAEQSRVVAVATTAAADSATDFTSSYKRMWALLPASEYEQEKVQDWTKRVTLEAWEYALKECVDHHNTGQWKYLETILKRVEKEGLPQVSPTTTYVNGIVTGFDYAELTGGA